MKASPLFKRSLEESIASLEGKASQTGAASGDAAAMPTGRPGCPQPDLPETEYSTCEPSVCGGYTCFHGPTCQGSNTCYHTCGTTCGSQSTCLNTCVNTCVGGSCANYHFYGFNWWYCWHTQGRGWLDDYFYQDQCGILPHGYFINSDENKLKWNDEGNWRSFGYWGIKCGDYDKTITRTTTSAGYTVRGEVTLWQEILYPPFGTYGTDVIRSSTQAQNYNEIPIYIGF